MSELLFRSQLCGALMVLALFSGCASVPEDLGRSGVNTLLTDRGLAVDVATEDLLRSLTTAPLSADSAVRIALMNNPRLRSSYATLGFGAADVYAAGRIRNPIFTGAFLDSNVVGESDQITLGLVASFTDLITLRARKRSSLGAFAALQQSVGAEILDVAGAAQKAYYEYLGAQQVAALRAQIAKAGALSAALAERYRDAGNLTPRELSMERAAASAARLIAIESEAVVYGARTQLAAILGLSVGDPWEAPAAMRLPVDVEDDLETLLALAKDARLDLAAARTRADVLANQLGVVNWTRWLGGLDAGFERDRETDGVKLTGPTVAWEVPIFDQHKGALMRANADLIIAVNDVRRSILDVDNSVRLAYARLENARARIEEYRNELIPQRIETVSRAQEEVNFILLGIFELIAFKKREYDAYQGYLEAIRDYWLARAELTLATGATLPSSARISGEAIDVEEFVRLASGGMDHRGHTMSPKTTEKPNSSIEDDHGKHKKQPEQEADHSGHGQHNQGGSR